MQREQILAAQRTEACRQNKPSCGLVLVQRRRIVAKIQQNSQSGVEFLVTHHPENAQACGKYCCLRDLKVDGGILIRTIILL